MNAVLETLSQIYDFIRPVLDVGIIAFLLYKVYGLLRRTNAVQILTAVLIPL